MDKRDFDFHQWLEKKKRHFPLFNLGHECMNENHHILGEGLSKMQIPLCKMLHNYPTAHQNSLSPKQRKNKQTFALIAIAGLLYVCYISIMYLCYLNESGETNEDIPKMRNNKKE